MFRVISFLDGECFPNHRQKYKIRSIFYRLMNFASYYYCQNGLCGKLTVSSSLLLIIVK